MLAHKNADQPTIKVLLIGNVNLAWKTACCALTQHSVSSALKVITSLLAWTVNASVKLFLCMDQLQTFQGSLLTSPKSLH